ncbi:hypothetical protein ACTPOE_04730 [Castellaniella sp. WN]
MELEADMLPVEDLLAGALKPADALIIRAKSIALLESPEIGFRLLADFLGWAA